MPTYEYRCPEGHQFELLQKMSQPARAKCPRCGRPAVRQISGGAALIFKGSGFYITDYGKDGKGPRKAPEESAPKSESKPETKSDKSDSPAAKPEPKAKPAKKASE